MIHFVHRTFVTAILILVFHQNVGIADKLFVKYQWKRIDFKFLSENEKDQQITSKRYIPENNVPEGIEIYEDRFFVTIPRFRPGVAASLAYFNLTDKTEDPVFYPYPSWDAHIGNSPEIVSPLKIKIDRCDRLWVLDTGIMDLWDSTKKIIREPPRNQLSKPSLLVYNLRDDKLIFKYAIPDELLKNDSLLANIAVEDTDCDDSYAYVADVKRSTLIVFSNKNKKSWLVDHHFFHMDPIAGNMTGSGVSYTIDYGLFGLALSAPDKERFSTLYFHPMASFREFFVSTKVLRNESLATSISENYKLFKELGSRGMRGESGVSFLDRKSNVIFYTSINVNAVICWRTTSLTYDMQSLGRIFKNESMMLYPSDIKVDKYDNLWVLSNKLSEFLYSVLEQDKINFRILTAPVQEAIQNTSCAPKLIVDPKIMNVLNATSGVRQAKSNNSTTSASITIRNSAFFIVTFLVCVAIFL